MYVSVNTIVVYCIVHKNLSPVTLINCLFVNVLFHADSTSVTVMKDSTDSLRFNYPMNEESYATKQKPKKAASTVYKEQVPIHCTLPH